MSTHPRAAEAALLRDLSYALQHGRNHDAAKACRLLSEVIVDFGIDPATVEPVVAPPDLEERMARALAAPPGPRHAQLVSAKKPRRNPGTGE